MSDFDGRLLESDDRNGFNSHILAFVIELASGPFYSVAELLHEGETPELGRPVYASDQITDVCTPQADRAFKPPHVEAPRTRC